MRVSPTEGCGPLLLGCAELGPLRGEARERGLGCFGHTRIPPLPATPKHPRGIPAPGSSSRQWVDVSRPRKEPESPGHCMGSAPLPGTAWHYSGLHRDGTAAPGTDTTTPKARPGIFLDGQKQAGEEGRERTGWGGGEKENISTVVGCHGRRYTGDAGASRYVSRAEELREVAGTSGRPGVRACAPGGLSRGAPAYRHLRRKELHEVPRGQSQSFPMRAPFLTAHCSPASHCGQRPAVSGTATSGCPLLPRPV